MSPDSAPDSAFAPSLFARSSGPLPSPIIRCPAGLARLKSSLMPSLVVHIPNALETDGNWQASPFVSAFVDAVDAAIRRHQPHHAMSVTQRTWLAFCITAVLVTNSFAGRVLHAPASAPMGWRPRRDVSTQ